MGVSLLIWAAVMVAALLAVRRQKASLGLTLAYLTGLLLIHVPGGLVHFLNPGLLSTTPEVAEGLRLSAIAALCFLVGLILFQRRNPQARRCLAAPARAFDSLAPNPRFWRFCLVAGLVFAFLASPLLAIPSIGAVVSTGSAIWMLGALLAYRWFTKQQQEQLSGWVGASLIYPVLTLFLGGFLSYGTSGLINALSVLLVTGRRFWRVLLAYGLTLVFALSVFTAYFQNRNAIRDAVWSGASLEQRIDSASGVIRDFHIFDPYADADITAIDQRLNQNYFAGLAALRIQTGQSNLLQGRTVGDALIAVIPRALWPDKPVAAGSSDLVAVATGLILSNHLLRGGQCDGGLHQLRFTRCSALFYPVWLWPGLAGFHGLHGGAGRQHPFVAECLSSGDCLDSAQWLFRGAHSRGSIRLACGAFLVLGVAAAPAPSAASTRLSEQVAAAEPLRPRPRRWHRRRHRCLAGSPSGLRASGFFGLPGPSHCWHVSLASELGARSIPVGHSDPVAPPAAH